MGGRTGTKSRLVPEVYGRGDKAKLRNSNHQRGNNIDPLIFTNLFLFAWVGED
jgi:hypothetical protein